MHREYGSRTSRQGAFDQIGINICGGRIDVHQNRLRAAIGDGLGRRKKCIGSSDYFVARLDSQREQSEMERGSSTAQRHAVLRSAKFCKFFLKGFDFLALNERGCLADAIEGRENFIPQLRVLRFEIENRYFHLCGTFSAGKNCTVWQPPPQAPPLAEHS